VGILELGGIGGWGGGPVAMDASALGVVLLLVFVGAGEEGNNTKSVST
jgi:hypothetical protein